MGKSELLFNLGLFVNEWPGVFIDILTIS